MSVDVCIKTACFYITDTQLVEQQRAAALAVAASQSNQPSNGLPPNHPGANPNHTMQVYEFYQRYTSEQIILARQMGLGTAGGGAPGSGALPMKAPMPPPAGTSAEEHMARLAAEAAAASAHLVYHFARKFGSAEELRFGTHLSFGADRSYGANM